MKEVGKNIASGSAFEELLPMLEGRVFHVTREKNWPQIVAAGKLLPEPEEDQYVSTFGSRSYFRQRGCISLFDYRDFRDESCQAHYHKCLPTAPLNDEDPIRILFLSPSHYDLLIPWVRWKIDGIGKANVVPYVEVGLAGEIPLTYFEEVMFVTITEDKSSFGYLLRSALRDGRNG